MKLDLTKLPVGEAIIGFLVVSLAVTFVLGFMWLDNDDSADGAPETPAPSDGATPRPGGTEIILHDNSFEPDTLALTAGETATLSITNEGSAIHNVRFAGEDGEYDTDDDAVSDPDLLRGGDTGTLEWAAPAEAGDYPFRCDFHSTEMTGTVTVQ